ncbi:MAG: glycerate kinase [Acidobacteriota bacterium]
MKFLLSPNALKGSLTAFEAACAMQTGLERARPDADTIAAPIADGGNGTLDCLASALHADYRTTIVKGPVGSFSVPAEWGITPESRMAIIEMAQASGLHLVAPGQLDVLHATTAGVGELIREAMNEGCTEIILGLGGSATNDGGAGCLRALGVRFLDEAGREIPEGGAALASCRSIDRTCMDARLEHTHFTVLSDVKNPLCGNEGASAVFGPQKGARAEDVRLLDKALLTYASAIEHSTGRRVADIPGAGAAGGFGAGLLAFCPHVTFVSGIDFVLDALGFDLLLKECDAVLTSEGMIDEQTTYGKAIAGLCTRARMYNKPVHAFVGRIEGDAGGICRALSLSSLTEISPRSMPHEEALRRASELLADSVSAFAAKSA